MVAFTCHPETPSDAVRGIDAWVRRLPEGSLAVSYRLAGDFARLRLPAPRPPGAADPLWKHTCFEIFIARKGLAAYHEFNFAPSGEWAAYAFERYREGERLIDQALDPQVSVRSREGKVELDALIRLDRLSPLYHGARLSLALSAVVEARDGPLSYWALAHAAGKPDFHHPDAFALELAAG